MRALLLVAALAGVASADDTSENADGFTHKGQFELSVRGAFGMRALATYHDTDYCGDTDTSASTGNAAVCVGRTPFTIDFEPAYGVGRAIDAFVELRIVIEPDFGTTAAMDNGPHQFHVSPGARFYFSDARRLRLFTTAQLVLDFSGYKKIDGSARGTDFGLRNMSGLWLDLTRDYGVYGFVGETATVVRWLGFEMEAGFGVQGRYK